MWAASTWVSAISSSAAVSAAETRSVGVLLATTSSAGPPKSYPSTSITSHVPKMIASSAPGMVSSGEIALTWSGATDNVGVTGYRVFRGTTQIASLGGSATSYTETNLAPLGIRLTLVDHGASEDGGAVVLGDEAEPVEPRCPTGGEMSLDADFVLRDARVATGRSVVGAVVRGHRWTVRTNRVSAHHHMW